MLPLHILVCGNFRFGGADSKISGSLESEELKRKSLFPYLGKMIYELLLVAELLDGIQTWSPTSDHVVVWATFVRTSSCITMLTKGQEVMVTKNNLVLFKTCSQCTTYCILICSHHWRLLFRLVTYLLFQVWRMGQNKLQQLAVMSNENEVLERVTHQKVR